MKCLHAQRWMLALAFIICCISCNQKTEKDQPVPIPPTEMDEHVQESMQQILEVADEETKGTAENQNLYSVALLKYYYEKNDFTPLWSTNKKWKPLKDSLLLYIRNCDRDGLFKESYQYDTLQTLISTIDTDTMNLQPPEAWAKTDLLLTDAFMHIIEDLKHGRLHTDSLSWKYDKQHQETFFQNHLDHFLAGASLTKLLQSLQPTVREYEELQKALPRFLDSMQRTTYTYLQYPFKDSARFYKKLVTRLNEEGIDGQFSGQPDSLSYANIVSAYQRARELPVTGKLSAGLINRLNNTDVERRKRIAITLDRYKQLSAALPDKYVWVNLPSYQLQVWAEDSLVLESKVIIGKPNTPTPLLISAISDLVIYPTWTVPNSIIRKEILPALKRDAGYLLRKGLALFDYHGNMVDPFTVDWTKYNKDIPYLVRQASGDDNALGVIKFNFKNPFSVYLHDTNQRYLFKNKSRSLSHGCVRVQDWEKLAFFIVRNDSMLSKRPDSLKLSTDSITTWVSRKQKQVVGIGNRLPLYIGYYTCVAVNGKIRFYDDVYGKDKAAREKYVAFK